VKIVSSKNQSGHLMDAGVAVVVLVIYNGSINFPPTTILMSIAKHNMVICNQNPMHAIYVT
jgi:hypothetical protein